MPQDPTAELYPVGYVTDCFKEPAFSMGAVNTFLGEKKMLAKEQYNSDGPTLVVFFFFLNIYLFLFDRQI